MDRYYVGHCGDIVDRLYRHNKGKGSAFTKKARDWELKWTKAFETRALATQLEMVIKKKESRKYVKRLISWE